MTAIGAAVGPGSVRVGRFIGRLGVVSLPAVAVGLDLEERVVRRHVAKLETAGWLAGAPWVWGEGSVAWLTTTGIRGSGLGSIRAVKSHPSPGTIAHGVLVGWSAARTERRGREWYSARELAVDGDRWTFRCGVSVAPPPKLPDLAVWVNGWEAPVAVVAECGGRREDRQRWILEGSRNAIRSGAYCAVRYECASESVVRWITRLAKKVSLVGSGFTATVQSTRDEIAAMSTQLARTEATSQATQPHSRPCRRPNAHASQVPLTRPLLRRRMSCSRDSPSASATPSQTKPQPSAQIIGAKSSR